MSQSNTCAVVAVGIDVAKASLSVCLIDAQGNRRTQTISNTETGINKWLLELAGYKGKIVLESTGSYHWLAARFLAKAELDIRVINPLLAKKYTTSSIRKVKTDKADAGNLAEMALIEKKLPPTFSMDEQSLHLRKKIGLLDSIEKRLQQFQSMLRDYEEAHKDLKQELTETEQQVYSIVEDLKRTKNQLAREFEEELLATGDEKMKERLELYKTIPGVSSFMAALAAHMFSPEVLDSPKQWVAYSGLDISVKESGTWKGHGRLTKRGNSYLRKRLFSAAWGAMMHSDQFKSYYEQMRKEGRSYKESMVIMSRKIVRIMFMMEKNNVRFDPSIALTN